MPAVEKTRNMGKVYGGMLCLLCIFTAFGAHAQDSSFIKKTYSKIFDKYVRVDSCMVDRDSGRAYSSHDFPVPVFGFSQERKVVIGLALIYSFYRNSFDFKALGNSFLISAGLWHIYQVRYRFKPHLFGTGKNYRVLEEINYQNFTQNYYGIGNHTIDSSFANLRQVRMSANIEVQKRLSGKIFLGGKIQYQYDIIRSKSLQGGFQPSKLDFPVHTGSTLFLGPTLLFDTRNFQNYADKGDYLNTQLLLGPSRLNSEHEMFSLLSFDARHYMKIDKKQVLALNMVAGITLSPKLPFLFLNQLGGGQIMRGYYTGRFRDRNVVELQAEYRYRLLPRVGASVFAATGQVFGMQRFDLGNFKPDFGGGLRYIFDLPSRSTIRMDYGIGQKLPGEKRIQGFYLAINEAF